MDICGICNKSAVQLFETGTAGVFACFKCQPLVPEVSLGHDHVAEHQTLNLQEGTESKELYCSICNKSFQKNMQLQNHLRNHLAERRFVCNYCNKAFSQSNNLRAHLRIHTNERPYKCNVCDKAFTQVTNLNNHIRLHTGERPFVCPEPGCNKAYAQVTNLNQHRKRHLNGRPVEASYDCTICGEQFEQRNHMYNHRREVHSNLKTSPTPRHVCKICEKSFANERRLMDHVAEHMNAVTPYMDKDRAGSEASDAGLGGYRCVFASCGARLASCGEHTEHLLRAHQLRVLSLPGHTPSKRGRPPKNMKMDPLDPKENITYDAQVKQLKEHSQFLPKLKVESLFQ